VADDDVFLFMAAVLVAMRLGQMLLVGARRDRAPYLALLAVDLAAIMVAISLDERGESLGFVTACVGLVLLIAPGVLDRAQAKAERRGDSIGWRRALRLARLREILVPGAAATRHRRALEHLALARSGAADQVLGELASETTAERDPVRAHHLYAEQVQVLLAVGRRPEAIALAERQLDYAAYERHPALVAAVAGGLCAEGRLRDALPLLALLEMQAAGRDVAAQPLLLPARLGFIAGAGLRDEIDRLLVQRAIANQLGAAERGRLHEIAAEAHGGDPDVERLARELAARLLEAAARASIPLYRRAPITVALLAINTLALLAVFALGLGRDELGLARAGALFRPAVLAGEWWRLGTAMFLHAGLLHLVANMYALLLLGRVTEEILGGARLLLIYTLAGIGGGLASLWADRGLSVGASGAIMGLLASLTVIVVSRRHLFHPLERRTLLGNLLFLAALQFFLGFQLPMIDNAAHTGGFVVGLLATAGLVPARELVPAARRALGTVAISIALAFVACAVMVARRPLGLTLERLPTAELVADGVRVTVPRGWTRDSSGLIVDRYLGIEARIARVGDRIQLHSPQADDPRVQPLLQRVAESARPVP
jgi:membrane associated rhomboid family serine protease